MSRGRSLGRSGDGGSRLARSGRRQRSGGLDDGGQIGGRAGVDRLNGGLGALAINYGYYRYKTDILLIVVVVLVLLVQIVQLIGTRGSRLVDHRLK